MLFRVARSNQPSLIFLDEGENCLNRDKGNAANPVCNQFLAETNIHDDVYLIVATNEPQRIDDGFYRRLLPVYIGLPNWEERVALLELFLRTKTNRITKADLEDIASKTAQFSPDDIAKLIEMAREIRAEERNESQFFRETITSRADRKVWTPCKENDKGAKKMTLEEISLNEKIVDPPLTLQHIHAALQKTRRTVTTEALNKMDAFNHKINQLS